MSTVVDYERANPAQRALRRFAATRPGSWLFANLLRRLDPPVYRVTRGRHTAANLVSGLPVVQLRTTGARTGVPRTVPVLGFPTSGGLAVIASNFGRAKHPGWYHNLRACPAAQVTVGGSTKEVRAIEAEGAARERIWRDALTIYPGWNSYQHWARHRRIGIFLLTC